MTTPRWLNDDEQKFWRLMLNAVRKVQHYNERVLQIEHNLTSSEFAVLVSLSEAENEEMRLRDLCAALDWDRSRTSHQVTRMEKRGLVEKRRYAGDARGILIDLTDEGKRRLIEAAPSHVESVRELVFDTITPELQGPVTEYLENIMRKDIGATSC
ncbi:MarR family winged helix-turn-helix transcriptional regulator [Corynebacterium felinum]|uniref:DNA-binding MarR family transcriptional regulator n=2 Tax=Corynebacterium felinum TaxID=131318 RepID=A0ABU2BC33_9CORY|nr:MarR family winged helix-turn-helix transcriptional regulator [Corynebacterium felinum]MDF5821884.1 MarR family winged helix-turn-helix transcriptional regulator [Corynebacterium felinum]MDR7355303.1 DNA-binding MarR family transcriptional regulator [Corynebacterium felinum]